MKIEVREDYTIQLEEVFNAIVIKTTDGVEFHICQRDYGIEITCNGVTKYLDEETFNTKREMKVYLVNKEYRGEYGETHLLKIFSTLEKAQAYVDESVEEDNEYRTFRFNIEEEEVE